MGSLGLLGLHSSIANMLIGEAFSRAYADVVANATPVGGQYIHFSLYRAPHRGHFDCPLVPSAAAADGVNFNQGFFGTAIDTSGPVPKAVYHNVPITIAGKTYYMPPVWGQTVGAYSLRDLFQNTLIIRGVDNQLNDHGLTNAMQVAPQIGTRSINGAVADASTRPIPGIVDLGCPAGGAFKDKLGYLPQPVSYTDNQSTNPVLALLQAFTNFKMGRVVHNAQASNQTDLIFSKLDDYAQANGVTQTALVKTYDNAMDLLDQGVVSLGSNANWTATKSKYLAIINNANTLTGIFDSKIQVSNDPRFYVAGSVPSMASGDMRDMIVPGTTGNDHLAQNFAVAELLLGKVTSNMVLNIPGLNRVNLTGSPTGGIDNDEHFTGSVASCIINTVYFRGLLGCMSELVAQYKSKSIWNNTVIHIGSEFNRIALDGDGGSQHHPSGSTATLISGMITAPSVIGNIRLNGSTMSGKGATDGYAAPYQIGATNRALNMNDIARTVTTMLGVDDVVTNGNALMAPKGDGTWIPVSEVAKNV